ncbi:MAG: hypothetical protein P4K98_02705, partial [Bryobacteraceae bacterium]|nr:hypothetical protein [Bryobacteraceae bacterium]
PLTPISVCEVFAAGAVRWLGAVLLCSSDGVPDCPFAAALVSATIPINIKVVSINFIRIFVSVFNFTPVLLPLATEAWLGHCRTAAPRQELAERLVTPWSGAPVNPASPSSYKASLSFTPAPKRPVARAVAESQSDYIGFAPWLSANGTVASGLGLIARLD